MGDRLRAGEPFSILPSHPGQLSLLPSAGREMSTNQSAVTLCGWELKAGVAHYGRPVELYFHPVVSFNLYLLFLFLA